MLIDLSLAESEITLDVEICIAGAGAAGVTLARHLCRSGHEVCLLESGGMDFEQPTQDLCAGSNLGMEYYELEHSRLRFFGGTTNIWGGRCVPLDRIDFERRSWVPHSGWPLAPEELAAYYQAAHDLLELGEYRYDDTLWDALPSSPIAFDPAEITHRFWRFDGKEERFNSRQSADLRADDNCKILLHANLVHLQARPSLNGIEHFVAKSLNGNTAIVRARHYVLACGAIENARLLLLSDDIQRCGVGNAGDQVGRYFMEHPHGRVAEIETADPVSIWSRYRKHFPRRPGPVVAPAIAAAEALQQSRGILNSAATFKLQRDAALGPSLGRKIYSNLKHELNATKTNRSAWHAYRRILRGLQRHAALPLARAGAAAGRLKLYLMTRAEQAPNPDSRVVLSREVDPLGLRRADLDWQLSEIDKRSVLELARSMGREFERLGLGKVNTADWLQDGGTEWPVDAALSNHPIGGYHHMGTTRMSSGPQTGVVDRDCTVHGHSNLHIAGSSVFTTAGWANPTLTILALSLRLGDHLQSLLHRER